MKRRYEKLIDNLSKNLKDIEVKQAHCFSVIDSTDDQELIRNVVGDMIQSAQYTDERIFNEAIYKKLFRNPNLTDYHVSSIIQTALSQENLGWSSSLFDLVATLIYIRKLSLSQLSLVVNLTVNRPTIHLELIECDEYEAFLDYYFKIEKERLMKKRNNREQFKKEYCI